MANRRPQPQGNGGRRMDFQRNDMRKNFGRSGVSPWQGGGPAGAGLPNLLPLGGGSTEATLALASNILNLLQPRQNPVPSLLDMPIRRDFVPNMGRFDRNFPPQRMGNQGNFRRTGTYNRAGERINNNRKQFKPNDGPRQQNKSPQKKEADSKAKPVKESEIEEKKEEIPELETKAEEPKKEETTKKESPKTRFDDVHTSLLKCHICNKSMWDGRSFENHLNGRAHSIMMQKTAESYALTADTMRQEFKIREMKRSRRSGLQVPRDFYCAMCDMYAADGGVHRTTVGHRKLKKYLHPTCTSCHKEMPTRIEMDEHRLTVDHLRTMHEKQDEINKPKQEAIVISTLLMEQSFLREDRQRKQRDQKDKQTPGIKTEDNVVDGNPKEPGTEGETSAEGVKTEVVGLDLENTILDYKDINDLTNITDDMLPTYSTERGVGASFLAPFVCMQCKLCNKVLDSQETAEMHLRTWKHYQLFVRSLQTHLSSTEDQNAQLASGSKRAIDSSDNGNWKRRRNNTDADAENDMEPENGDDAGLKAEPRDKEALNDTDCDVEMPNPDELEDWEQSVDEILEDEQYGTARQPADTRPQIFLIQPDNDSQPEPEIVPKSEPAPSFPLPTFVLPTSAAPFQNKTRGSPIRGRGRGRGRN